MSPNDHDDVDDDYESAASDFPDDSDTDDKSECSSTYEYIEEDLQYEDEGPTRSESPQRSTTQFLYPDFGSEYIAFKSTYRCYPLSLVGKSHLEIRNQIIMPQSALYSLLNQGHSNNYPMLFEIQNPVEGRLSHCGVSEFTAEEGTVHLPGWMMENLKLNDGDLVDIASKSLEKGTFMKLQPHSMDFLDIPNPKAVLEASLGNNYFCVTEGDTIVIKNNKQSFYIDILETRPSPAINIVNTDCKVDFALPLDYKEPEKKPAQPAKPVKDEAEKEQPKFAPFTGRARRLVENVLIETNLISAQKVHQTTVKVGSTVNDNRSKKIKIEHVAAETSKKNEFWPFTGRKYSLMD